MGRELTSVTYRHMKGAAGAVKRDLLGRAVGGTFAETAPNFGHGLPTYQRYPSQAGLLPVTA
jgi:hypothetical protein